MPAIHTLITCGQHALCRAGVASPRVDAEWILAHILRCGRSDLALRARQEPSSLQVQTFKRLIAERARRVPLQHLLGETEFYGLPFCTTPDALIPRPDTETLVEHLLSALSSTPNPRILDIGTGTGAIAIAIAHERADARVVATDISRAALDLASRNARQNEVENRVRFLCADLLGPFAPAPFFHAIVSNPPYIPTPALKTLAPEVRDHDPHQSLDGGPDGLDFYRKIIPAAVSRLAPNGWLAFEMGHDQAEELRAILTIHPELAPPSVSPDLAGLPRAVLTHRCA